MLNWVIKNLCFNGFRVQYIKHGFKIIQSFGIKYFLSLIHVVYCWNQMISRWKQDVEERVFKCVHIAKTPDQQNDPRIGSGWKGIV